jgi:hypothetical protein
VPSLLHEVLVEMFRKRAELALDLLRVCAGIVLEGTSAELGSVDLSQVASPEYRADAVVILRDENGIVTAAVIVEIQLSIDPDKQRTWPVYTTVLRAVLDCPVTLLVLVRDDAVRRWARQPIELGHPGFALQPIVVAYEDIPRITDPAMARAAPELAVLSAIAHSDLEVARATLEGIRALPEDVWKLYLDVVLMTLPALARQILEAEMKESAYESEFGAFLVDRGREEGREQGREEGLRKARERLQTLALALARARLGTIDDQLEARVHALTDDNALDELALALGSATNPEEAHAALDRLAPDQC